METKSGLTEAQEDYLEAIYRAILKNGAARVKDIAAALGVRYPSVTSALQALAKRGLINYEPYGLVTLTKSGYETAIRVTEKHRLLKTFLANVLGLGPADSDETACRMEHVIEKDAYVRFLQFIKFLHVSKRVDEKWVAEFRKFCAKDTGCTPDACDLDEYFRGTGFTMPGGNDVSGNA